MKLTKTKLKQIIREELNEIGGYGSQVGREEADVSFESAMDTLHGLIAKGKITVQSIMDALRGGGPPGHRPPASQFGTPPVAGNPHTLEK